MIVAKSPGPNPYRRVSSKFIVTDASLSLRRIWPCSVLFPQRRTPVSTSAWEAASAFHAGWKSLVTSWLATSPALGAARTACSVSRSNMNVSYHKKHGCANIVNKMSDRNKPLWARIDRPTRSAIEERTPGIGFGIKDASKRDVNLPEIGTLLPPLQRTHAVTLRPFFADKFFSARFERPFLHAGISRCLLEKAHPVFQTAATRHFG